MRVIQFELEIDIRSNWEIGGRERGDQSLRVWREKGDPNNHKGSLKLLGK